MNTTADVFRGRGFTDRSQPDQHAIVRQRVRTAAVLTVLTLALGIVLFLWLGKDILPIYVMPLPFGLFLLWSGADVLRADERSGE